MIPLTLHLHHALESPATPKDALNVSFLALAPPPHYQLMKGTPTLPHLTKHSRMQANPYSHTCPLKTRGTTPLLEGHMRADAQSAPMILFPGNREIIATVVPTNNQFDPFAQDDSTTAGRVCAANNDEQGTTIAAT